VFPTITIELPTVSLPAPVASSEYTFNMLQHVGKYYHSTTLQGGLVGFFTPSINCDLVRNLDFFSIINTFFREIG
jgi:hypothetical protein